MTSNTLKLNRRQFKLFCSDLMDLAESYDSLFSFSKRPEIQEIYPVLISELNERLALLHQRSIQLESPKVSAVPSPAFPKSSGS